MPSFEGEPRPDRPEEPMTEQEVFTSLVNQFSSDKPVLLPIDDTKRPLPDEIEWGVPGAQE